MAEEPGPDGRRSRARDPLHHLSLADSGHSLADSGLSHLKLGYFMDERGALGGIDVRVKKTRGCQGSGSAARHRFFGTYFYFNEGLFSRVVVSIFKIVY